MIKRILRDFSYIFLTIFLCTSTMFSGVSTSQAVQTGTGDNGDNSLGIKIEESTEKTESLNTIAENDLGDDQSFPFIPGFGKE